MSGRDRLTSSLRLVVSTTHHVHAKGDARIPDKALDKLFRRLDSADGRSDGRIALRPLVDKLLPAVDGRRDSADSRKALRLVMQADSNHDGFLDRTEFPRLFRSDDDDQESQGQQEGSSTAEDRRTAMLKLLKKAANAERYRWCPPPWFVIAMILGQIGYFIFHIFHFLNHEGHRHQRMSISMHGPYPYCSKLLFNPKRRHELWRFVSYFLVHAGLEHLLINVFLQLLVGLLLEMSNGWIRLALIYLTGILAGSLGTSTFSPKQFLAGASGAVFALVGAHVASMLLNWKEDGFVIRQKLRHSVASASDVRSTGRAKIFRSIRLAFVVILCLLDFFRPLYDTHHAHNEASTSYSAHLSGLFAGFLVGAIVLRNREVESWERLCKLVCTVLLCLLLFATVTWNVLGDDIVRKLSGNAQSKFFYEEDYGVADGHNGSCTYNDDYIKVH